MFEAIDGLIALAGGGYIFLHNYKVKKKKADPGYVPPVNGRRDQPASPVIAIVLVLFGVFRLCSVLLAP